MKYFVKWDCLSMKTGINPSKEVEDLFSKQLEHIEKSGKMKDGGALLGVRGGYFILDVDKPADILGLLGRVMLENFSIELHPVVSFKEIGAFMQEEDKKAA